METSVLEMILRQDALQTGGESLDIDEILYITEVLAEREKRSDNPGKTPEEALEDFKKNFLYTDTGEHFGEIPTISAVREKRKTRPKWFRYAATAAATIALVFITSLTVKSLGHDIRQGRYLLTSGTFQFVTEPALNNNQSCPQTNEVYLYHDFLKKNEFAAELLPTHIPEGFQQTESHITMSAVGNSWAFAFENGDRFCQIILHNFLEDPTVIWQRSDDYFEVREINGISYYIFTNLDQLVVCWKTGPFECGFYGDLTLDEINDILNSIKGNK